MERFWIESSGSPVDDVISLHACWLAESPDPTQHVLLGFSAHDVRPHPLMNNLQAQVYNETIRTFRFKELHKLLALTLNAYLRFLHSLGEQ